MAREAAATRLPDKRGSRLSNFLAYIRKYWFLYMLILPGFVCMVVFNYAPMYGIQLAFKNYSPRAGIWGSEWIGFNNFARMFKDPNFIRAFKNTISINLKNLAFGFTFNVFLALMINEMKLRRVKPIVQTCVYLPYFLSWVIFAGLVQVFLEYPSTADVGGVLNQIIGALGGEPIDFLKQPKLFQTILVITNVIKTAGYSTIVYLASLAGVDPALYESAQIDGANGFQRIRYITLPTLKPTVVILFLFAVGGILKGNFGLFYNLVGNNSMLFKTTDIIETYVYRSMMNSFNFAQSSAVGLFQSVVGFFIVIAANAFAKKLDPDYALF